MSAMNANQTIDAARLEQDLKLSADVVIVGTGADDDHVRAQLEILLQSCRIDRLIGIHRAHPLSTRSMTGPG